jgi:hypothetical protein
MPKKNTGNAAITENADTGQGEMQAQSHDAPGLPDGSGEGTRTAASESSPMTGTGTESGTRKRSSQPRKPKDKKPARRKENRVAESEASPEVAGAKNMVAYDKAIVLGGRLRGTITEMQTDLNLGKTQILETVRLFLQ